MEKSRLRNQFLFEQGSDQIPLLYDEQEGNEFRYVDDVLLLYSPTGLVDLVRDPSGKNLARAAFGPAFFSAVGVGATYLFGAPAETLAQRYTIQSLASWHGKGQLARALLVGGARTAATTTVLAAPAFAAAATTYVYEKYVNRSIRDSHGGSQGTWFGPLGGSGFGTVV